MKTEFRNRSRHTAVAVIDREERVLLSRVHGTPSWRPVTARVIRILPSRFSVVHVLDSLFSHWFFARTPVVGRYNPLPGGEGLDESTRIFAVRRSKMRSISLRARAHVVMNVDYVWHPLSDVEDVEFDVYPRELGPFLRGYIEGWIPDGVITLVE
ncbi:hypothetical protein ACOT81_27780 [Streptomyces sp. WI04-05B]|uniref:hypothetical protein n=1 Tax=Streptomyces TaxID=1883 RepID=UPI0029BE5AC0|nr:MULTISPECIES: hypothetical protein [unclassified Streptomyces]MDX2546743.1 hypothetical protein [Streptomyces sp. WI04-05B]MDX2589539.1 hypothetical protein [Streptomyces sp. WI04-05A]